MKRLIRLAAIILLTSALPALGSNLLPFTAELEAIRYGLVDLKTGGTLRLARDDGQWHYRLATDGRTVSLTEEVWFTFEDDVIRPQRYAFDSKVFWHKESKRLSFDHNTRRVTGVVDKEKISENFNPPLYDAIGYQLALQQQLVAGEREISFTVFRHKRPDRMAFRVIGEEQLSLPSGDVYTWIIEQTDPVGRDERKLIWVAPNLNYVPLRFGRYEDGKLKEEIRTISLRLDGQRISFDD